MNRIIFYDLGNVVVLTDHAKTHQHLLDQFGIQKEVSATFYNNNEYKEYARGKISDAGFSQALRTHIGRDLSDKQLQHAHDVHIYNIDQTVLNLIQQTKAKNTIGIISNTCGWQERRVKELYDFRQEVARDLYFCSHELGKLKADNYLQLFLGHYSKKDWSSV